VVGRAHFWRKLLLQKTVKIIVRLKLNCLKTCICLGLMRKAVVFMQEFKSVAGIFEVAQE